MGAITDHRAKKAVAKLRAEGIADVGVHLRDSGRRAIAHAREEPIIDPDDPSDNRRLWSELPIVTALAQLAIEEVFSVETRGTVYRKQLYELAGFKKILGSEIVGHLTRGDQITDGRMVDIPKINVQIRRREPYPPKSALIGRWTRMRQFPGSFSRTEPSNRSSFSEGFTITTFGFNFRYGQQPLD